MTAPPTSTSTEPPQPSGLSVSTKALIGVFLAGTVGIVIFLFVHLSSGGGGPRLGTQTAQAGCTSGRDCLPNVAFIDTNGVAHTVDKMRGKVVVVNFWATWCKPCMKEIPDLSRVYDKYKNQVVMLGVLTSDNPDNATLLNFQSDNEMSFPVVRATSDILASFDYPGSLPTTFIFDRSGHQVTSKVGAFHAEQLTSILEPLLVQ